MTSDDARSVFESLTAKQHETLSLASRHLTSKQIAARLGVAPVTIDKRIETVRGRVGSLPRPDLLRLYGDWLVDYGRSINEPIILPDHPIPDDEKAAKPDRYAYVFEDSLQLTACNWMHALRGIVSLSGYVRVWILQTLA